MSLKSSDFNLREEDAIRLVLEFLSNRDLNISQLSCERETGVFNGLFSDDLLFLRQLILDGQWDDVLQFVQPLESIETFDKKQFKYLVNKHKYIELLCIRSEAGPLQSVEVAVNQVVQCLNHLEQFCPNKEDYNELCLLLTLPNLCDHKDFKHWNPSKWRINCFKAILPLIEKYLPPDKKSNDSMPKMAKGDRLMQLIIKGILYESCVEYCQQKATNSSANKSVTEMKYSSLLDGTGFSNSDLSLLSWLQSIPPETFSYPFEQKTLNVEVEQLEKPSLMASWSEVILVTPIKPKVFPHSATPFTRIRASDLMSKSLTPGLVDGLTRSLMTFSVCDMAAMSRSSFAATGFHLNSNNTGNSGNKKDLQTSVDRLFEEGEVFSSTCFGTLPTIPEKPSPVSATLVDEQKFVSHNESKAQMQLTPKSAKDLNQSQNTPDLWQKFQKEKQKLMQKLMNEEMLINSSGLQSNAKNSAQSLNDSYLQTPPIVSMANNSSNEKVTPSTQTGFSNFPNPERLTTSTPKGNHLRFREGINFSPNESPIFPTTQNGLSQQRNLSFNRSANEVLTTNSSLSSHQSSQQPSYASQLPKANIQTMVRH
jgi:hypothetical protein